MVIEFTADQEALLGQIAARTGKDTADVVREAVASVIEHEAWFTQAVQQGRAAAEQGRLVDHDQVMRRVQRRFGG